MSEGDSDADRLRLILHLAGLLEGRLNETTFAAFEGSVDELDLTAFRLGHIGENAQKLSAAIKHRHPEIEWSALVAFRNIMFHSYLRMNPDHIWSAARNSLPVLVTVAKLELARIEQ